MATEPKFIYDNETNEALCVITDRDNIFVGTAICHPDDLDFASEKVGMKIAHLRASIKCLQHYKNNEIKPKIAALRQLYYSINKSKKFNEKSYENYMLQRQIRNYQDDLAVAQLELNTLKKKLYETLQNQEKAYQIVRNKRKIEEEQGQK